MVSGQGHGQGEGLGLRLAALPLHLAILIRQDGAQLPPRRAVPLGRELRLGQLVERVEAAAKLQCAPG